MKNRKRGILPDTFGAYVLNNAPVAGKYDIPQIGYFGQEIPDFIALYSNPIDYRKTGLTCVAFFLFDNEFDGMNGLWNAIVNQNKRLLSKYKERFRDVKFIVPPDYSITGDMPLAMQIFNVYRSRAVAIWIRDNCGCTIIPNLRFNNRRSYEFCFDGIPFRSVVCLSILGLCAKSEDVSNLKLGLHEAIKRIRPSALIVYGECKTAKFCEIFKEVILNNIPIIQPNNRYKNRWRKHYGIAE